MVAGDIHEPVNILQISTEKLKTRLAKDLRVEEAQISYQLPLTMVVRVSRTQGSCSRTGSVWILNP
ncbi:MAG: FtsQ-type POTRA domain-containing protein [Veillonella parvula]